MQADYQLNPDETEVFLDMLIRKRVESFQGFGLVVVFKDDAPKSEVEEFQTVAPKAQVEDDGHSTSNKPVEGFRNPMLWQGQNGKVLKFDGSLE